MNLKKTSKKKNLFSEKMEVFLNKIKKIDNNSYQLKNFPFENEEDFDFKIEEFLELEKHNDISTELKFAISKKIIWNKKFREKNKDIVKMILLYNSFVFLARNKTMELVFSKKNLNYFPKKIIKRIETLKKLVLKIKDSERILNFFQYSFNCYFQQKDRDFEIRKLNDLLYVFYEENDIKFIINMIVSNFISNLEKTKEKIKKNIENTHFLSSQFKYLLKKIKKMNDEELNKKIINEVKCAKDYFKRKIDEDLFFYKIYEQYNKKHYKSKMTDLELIKYYIENNLSLLKKEEKKQIYRILKLDAKNHPEKYLFQ